ncbi:hypothetical protein NU688_27900 [Variovorax sp. ZS18.2.2]|uniref:hypothetical protein n=1 Tax=Variovorax sp. ZS18.2.2 TaxID=2971255 RepID=UPI002151DC00|nr:hypothetical protein [Variovorax sp. ZS18.2.2]MCR6480009.1 hypothetical protein [Variovorax sp. ZS18.2.2]
MTAWPRTLRAAVVVPAALLTMLLVSGCSHYHIGIPLVPGLSLGLGASKDGNFSVGLNTGWGPLGAGVSVNNTGVVAGNAGVGVGVGIGPIGAGVGVGVGKSVVLHDPNAGKAGYAPAGGAAPVTTAAVGATVPISGTSGVTGVAPVAMIPPAAPVTVTKGGVTRPVAASAPQQQAPAVRVSYSTPAPAAVPAGSLGTPGNPVAP